MEFGTSKRSKKGFKSEMTGVKAQNQERRHSESNPLAEPIKIIFYSVLKILYTCISAI